MLQRIPRALPPLTPNGSILCNNREASQPGSVTDATHHVPACVCTCVSMCACVCVCVQSHTSLPGPQVCVANMTTENRMSPSRRSFPRQRSPCPLRARHTARLYSFMPLYNSSFPNGVCRESQSRTAFRSAFFLVARLPRGPPSSCVSEQFWFTVGWDSSARMGHRLLDDSPFEGHLGCLQLLAQKWSCHKHSCADLYVNVSCHFSGAKCP